MSFLTGSAPKVEQLPPQPTTSPSQQNILGQLSNLFTQQLQQLPQGGAAVPSYPAQTVAPQTQGQQDIISQLQGVAKNVPTGLPSSISNLLGNYGNAIQGAQGYQAPQVTAPQTGYAPQGAQVSPAAATQAFKQGVIDPVTQNFQQTVIPSLNAGAGRSAGGIYSSDLAGATDQAVSNLNTTLTGAGSQYAYNTQTANQQAALTNQNLLGQLALGNLGAQTSTNQLNVGSALQGQQDVLQAMGLTPGAVSAGVTGTYAPSAYTSDILTSMFPTISTPQTTAEQGLQTQIQELTGQASLTQNLEQIFSGLATAGTQQPQTVVTGGQQGILGNLIGGLAGNQGVTNAIGSGISSLFAGLGGSDEALKTDIRKVGRTDRSKLPVYTFRYKTDPANVRRMGLMAQDVEDVYPEAIGHLGPFKTVDYAAVSLAEAFPEKKAA